MERTKNIFTRRYAHRQKEREREKKCASGKCSHTNTGEKQNQAKTEHTREIRSAENEGRKIKQEEKQAREQIVRKNKQMEQREGGEGGEREREREREKRERISSPEYE